MASQQAVQLAQVIRQKVEEMKKLCEGLDEKTASRAPSGRWSPKQIISHISGPDGVGLTPAVRLFLDQETPRIDLNPGDPFFTERRSKMTVAELLKEFESEWERIAGIVAGLSDEQLARKAHIPAVQGSTDGRVSDPCIFCIHHGGAPHRLSHRPHEGDTAGTQRNQDAKARNKGVGPLAPQNI